MAVNTTYPQVAGEFETLEAVLAGASIARYGDGEFNLARGGSCVSQVPIPALALELQQILIAKHKECLIGIPTMDPAGPKYRQWVGYTQRFAEFLSPKKRYYSAFISRPDSAADNVNTQEFYDKVESLWRDQDVTLVGNGRRSLTEPKLALAARSVKFLQCSFAHSYDDIDMLYQGCIKAGNQRVILCAGPTATCLAFRLSKVGMHAIDLGHLGMFWRRYEDGKKKL